MIMCLQSLVSFCQFVLKILSKNQILISIKGRNSVANLRKTMIYNTNVHLVNDNAYTKRNFINICKISFNKRYLLYTYICLSLMLPFKKLVLVLMLSKAWQNSQSKAV